MRGILKNTLLLLGGMALGSLATRRAIRYAVENRYDRVKYEEPIFGTGEDAEQVLDGLKTSSAPTATQRRRICMSWASTISNTR
ncbi:MAG: hypothetical protein ACLRNW_01430 [Neglectibacter sp.]